MLDSRPRIALACALTVALFLAVFFSAGCHPLAGTDGTFELDGLEIRYYDVGAGDPLILLHGFATSAVTQWSQLAGDLAPPYRLIIPDHRGHGGSDKPVGAEHYGPAMVDDVVALMNHLEIDRARLAGMSMGGFMTLHALVRHPDRFRCALVGAAGWLDPERLDEEEGEEMAQAFERGEGFERLNARLNPSGEKAGWLGTFFFNLLLGGQDPMVLASVYRGIARLALPREALERNGLHALVVIGDEDGFLPMARELAEIAPAYELVVLPGHDHGSVGVDARFLESMKDFLADEERCGP